MSWWRSDMSTFEDCEVAYASMATLRPNWFLISPVLIASGQCSLMTWYSSEEGQKKVPSPVAIGDLRLIPMMAVSCVHNELYQQFGADKHVLCVVRCQKLILNR